MRTRSKLSAAAWALAATLLMPVVLFGQEVPPGDLTLEDAVQIALQNNPNYLKNLNNADVSAAGVRQGWGGLLPNLRASMGFSGSSRTTVTGTDNFGDPISRDNPLKSKFSSSSQSVSLGMTLFDGGASWRKIGQARAAARQTDAGIQAAQVQLRAQVARLYYEALRRQRAIDLEEQLLASAQERLDRQERLFRIAGAGQTDVLGARVDVARQEQSLAQAKGQADKGLLDLKQAMGVAGNVDFRLTSEVPEPFDPGDLDADALVQRALATNPQIQQQDAAVAVAQQQASIAKAQRFPTITAGASYSRSMSLTDYGAIWDFNPNQNRGLSFQIQADLPVFSRFQTSYTVAQASAAAEDARHDRQTIRQQVEHDVRAAVIDLVNAYQSLQLAQQSSELARQRLELGQEQFRLGSIQFINLQQLIDGAAQAEREALNAQFGFASARATLEEKVGSIINPPRQ